MRADIARRGKKTQHYTTLTGNNHFLLVAKAEPVWGIELTGPVANLSKATPVKDKKMSRCIISAD